MNKRQEYKELLRIIGEHQLILRNIKYLSVDIIMKTLLVNTIKEINKLTLEDNDKIITLLQSLLEDYIQINLEILKLDLISKPKKIELGPIEKEFRINFGVKRSADKIILADWIFDLQPTTKTYILYFMIIKEGLLHFLKQNIMEIDEAIINIITILWLQENFKIKSLDNPAMAAIRSRIFTDTIAGVSFKHLNACLSLLFIKKIPYNDVFLTNIDILFNSDMKEFDKLKEFNNWVNSLLKDEDVIAPINIKAKILPIVNEIVELGYENSSSTNIAKKLGFHENTIRKYFQELSSTLAISWRPILNFEKLKLHNYFLKVIINDQKNFNKIFNKTWTNIPYNKTIYKGKSDTSQIIYCPSLICPHITSETLNEILRKFENENIIESYNLQLIREKKMYSAITKSIINPTIKTFEKLLLHQETKDIDCKYILSHEKRNFSMEFDDRNIMLDYNLLFFLSILRGKPLLKSRYDVIAPKLVELYKKNNIPLSDVKVQTDFLNQIEIRARKRKILSYSLFMRSFAPRSSNVFIFEIHTLNYSEKEISETIEKLRVFSFLGQFTIADRLIFMIPGISHKHEISNMIKKIIEKAGLKTTCYTINLHNSRFVPLHELYDYDSQKWRL